MRDAHMHERGMLEWVEHPELGPVVMPTTPLRLHGTDVPPFAPSPRLGQHNEEIFGGMLGLNAEEIATLKRDGVL